MLVEPRPTVANVRLAEVGGESKVRKPKAWSPDAKFNDSAIQSKDVDEILTFRLALSREFSEVSLFDWGKTQLLPSLLLPFNSLSHVLEETRRCSAKHRLKAATPVWLASGLGAVPGGGQVHRNATLQRSEAKGTSWLRSQRAKGAPTKACRAVAARIACMEAF